MKILYMSLLICNLMNLEFPSLKSEKVLKFQSNWNVDKSKLYGVVTYISEEKHEAIICVIIRR